MSRSTVTGFVDTVTGMSLFSTIICMGLSRVMNHPNVIYLDNYRERMMRRKPVTDESLKNPVTDDNVTEDAIGYQNNSDDCGLRML